MAPSADVVSASRTPPPMGALEAALLSNFTVPPSLRPFGWWHRRGLASPWRNTEPRGHSPRIRPSVTKCRSEATIWRILRLKLSRNVVAQNVAGRRARSSGRAGFEFQRASRAEYHRRKPPGPEPMIDANHPIRFIDEHDVNRETHKEHVHPHHRQERSVIE